MKTILLIAILATSVFAQNAASQRAAKVTNPGVTAAFVYCAAGDSNCETANRVRNDSATPYQNGVGGVSAVFNVISGSQDLTIGLYQARSAIFDLRVNTGGGVAGLWTSTPQLVQPYFNVRHAYNAKLNCGTAATCDINLITDMNAGGWKVSGSNVSYAMFWNPNATTRPVNTPDITVRVNVHYVKDINGEVYTITPIPNGTGLVIAGLEATSGRTVTAAGQYHMPFTLTVRPQ